MYKFKKLCEVAGIAIARKLVHFFAAFRVFNPSHPLTAFAEVDADLLSSLH